jgi:photosystem II stability/assembly factor-like uncharacterized protein
MCTNICLQLLRRKGTNFVVLINYILMRRIFTLSLLLVISFANAQKIGKSYLPGNAISAPAWMQCFYTDALEHVNVLKLDAEVAAYEQSLERTKPEHQQGTIVHEEEGENEYVLFYKRWRRAMSSYILEDGNIDWAAKKAVPSESFTKSSINPHPKKVRGASSTWSLVGPEETFWRKEHVASQPAAPWQVNCYAIAMAPSNHDILYTAPETGGLFKTTDKGLNWNLALDQPLATSTFLSIAIHPTNPDIVYAGRDNMIRKTTDGGLTWNTIALSCGDINTIAIKPSNTGIIVLATENGVYRSTDSGATYSLVAGMTTTCYDVKFNEANDDSVVVLSKFSTWISARYSGNSGANFTVSTGWTGKGFTSASGARLATTPADPNRMYAVILATGTTPNKPYIFKSIDGGVTWDTTVTGIVNNLTGNSSMPLGMSNGQGYYDLGICANPSNANEVIVGSTSSYKSVDGGNTFTPLGGYNGPFSIHPDIQEIISLGNDTWIATDGGANYSNDFFTTHFEPRFKGIFGADFWGFTQGWNEDIVGGGRYHNGNTVMYENFPAGQSLRMGGAESGTGYYMIGRTRGIVFGDLGDKGLYVPNTINGICTPFPFNKIPNEDGYGSDASEVEFYPTAYNTIYLGKDSMLWKSSNGGISWTSLHSFPNKVKKFEISRSNPSVIYLAATNALWKSTDSGFTWTQLTMPSGTSVSRLKIEVDYDNPDRIWICSPSNTNNNKIHKSIDGGATWINLSTTALNSLSFQTIALQQGTLGGIYIAADGGKVFYRNDTMSNWAPFNVNLPQGTSPLKITPFYRDGKLRLAGNRGVWEVDFYEPSEHIVQPTVDRNVSVCPKDTFFFDDYSVVDHSTATWSWSFPGASFVSSTSVRNPMVLYAAQGMYNVSLTVTQNGISKTKVVNNMINVVDNICQPDTIPGHALSVNAQENYAISNTVHIPATKTYTMMAWVKANGLQVNTAGILSLGTDSGNVHLNLRNAGVDSTQIGYHHPDGSWSFNTGLYLKPNVWAHLALVIDSNKIVIYKDGVASTHTGRNIKTNNITGMIIGSMKDALWYRNFNGLLDEVALFNTALSQDQIRESMNLTLNNPNYFTQYNPNLVAYYQFNEASAQSTYDKIGNNHLSLVGADVNKDTASSAPVGGGVAQRLAVTTGGSFNFAVPGVTLTFPGTGTIPNGDLVVSRINVPSDELSSSSILPNNPLSYFVVRNYGTNKTFAPVTSMKFSNIQGTDANLAANPHLASLYKRSSNAHSTTWGSAIDSADMVTNTAGVGTIEFSAGLNMTSFSQFSIANSPIPLSTNGLVFDALLNALNYVTLDWNLQELGDTKTFYIEHSTDANKFTHVGDVASSGANSYGFVHKTPKAGKNYYRLKVMDTDGKYYYSTVRNVFVALDDVDVLVSPNPSSDGWISLAYKGVQDNEVVAVQIVSSAGQAIGRYSMRTSAQAEFIYIEVPGVYNVQCVFSNGKRIVKRIVVQ